MEVHQSCPETTKAPHIKQILFEGMVMKTTVKLSILMTVAKNLTQIEPIARSHLEQNLNKDVAQTHAPIQNETSNNIDFSSLPDISKHLHIDLCLPSVGLMRKSRTQ